MTSSLSPMASCIPYQSASDLITPCGLAITSHARGNHRVLLRSSRAQDMLRSPIETQFFGSDFLDLQKIQKLAALVPYTIWSGNRFAFH